MGHFEKLIKFCQCHPSVYCYGAGLIGNRTNKFLRKYNINIRGYIVSQKKESENKEIRLYQIDEVIGLLDEESGIILSLDERFHQEITKELLTYSRLNVSDIFPVTMSDVVNRINVDLAEGISYFSEIDNRDRKWADDFIKRISDIELEKQDNFQKQYAEICEKYKKIIFAQYNMRHIGEMCLTYYLWSIENKEKRDVLYVMIPVLLDDSYDKIPNKYLFDKIQDEMVIIKPDNYEFWRWIFQYCSEKIEITDQYNWVNIKHRDMDYLKSNNSCFQVNLDNREKEVLSEMNIGDVYICIYSRDKKYYEFIGQEDTECVAKARNSSIADYELMAKNYREMGVPLVRMGYQVAEDIAIEGIIDYANKYRSEKLDFYLLSKCKFFMVSGSGIMFIAKLFNTPMAVVNSTVISFGGDTVMPMSPEKDLIIMKKLWHPKQGRYLSLDEILYIEGKVSSYELFEVYASMGIVFHSNSQEELLDIAEEMRARIDGNMNYTNEDEELQERYRDILKKNVTANGNHYYNGRFGASFLKKNPWFLEKVPAEVSIKKEI